MIVDRSDDDDADNKTKFQLLLMIQKPVLYIVNRPININAVVRGTFKFLLLFFFFFFYSSSSADEESSGQDQEQEGEDEDDVEGDN